MESIVLIIILIVIIYLIFFRKKSTALKSDERNNYMSLDDSLLKTNDPLLIYKTKGLKIFNLVGAFYRNLNHNEKGPFNGYAITTDNDHDQYAVAIYKNNNLHVGYIPKGNKRMHDSINELHGGRIIVYGELSYSNYGGDWTGMVYIPVMQTAEELNTLSTAFKLQELNRTILSNKESSGADLFQVILNHTEILKLLNQVKNIEGLPYSLPKTVIPSLTTKLEKEKEWELLSDVENYPDLINELSEKYKNATYMKIEAAKKRLKKLP